MQKRKTIDSCIDALKKIQDDPNNELSSEQRSRLKKDIRDLKKLKRATNLTYTQVFVVVSTISEHAIEILNSGLSE